MVLRTYKLSTNLCVLCVLFAGLAGVRMVYPACLVLVAQSDVPAPAAVSSSGTAAVGSGGQHCHTTHREPAISSVTLTPPTSPEEAQKGTVSIQPEVTSLCPVDFACTMYSSTYSGCYSR